MVDGQSAEKPVEECVFSTFQVEDRALGTEVSLTWGYLGLYAVNLGLLGTAWWQPTALLGGKFL